MLKTFTDILEKVDSQAERAIRGNDAAENAGNDTPKESTPIANSPRVSGLQEDLIARNAALEAQIRDQYRELEETRELLAETRKKILGSDPAKLETLGKDKQRLQSELNALKQQIEDERKAHASKLAEVQKELESIQTLHDGNKMELQTVRQVHENRAEELSMENARLSNELSELKTKLSDAEAHQALLMLRIQGADDDTDLDTLRDPIIQAAVNAATERTRRECTAISENEMATLSSTYQKEIQGLKLALSEATETAETLKRVLRDRETQLEEIESKHTKVSSELEVAKRQIQTFAQRGGLPHMPMGDSDTPGTGGTTPIDMNAPASNLRVVTEQLLRAKEEENRLRTQINSIESNLRLERQKREDMETENAQLHRELQQLKRLFRNSSPGYMLPDLEKGGVPGVDEDDDSQSRYSAAGVRVFDLGTGRHVQRLFYPLSKMFHTRYEIIKKILHQLDVAYEGLFRYLVNPYIRIGAVFYLLLIHIWSLVYLFFHTHSIKSGGSHSH